MADLLYKCVQCGWILEEEEGGKKPEACEECGSDVTVTIVAIKQTPGQVGH